MRPRIDAARPNVYVKLGGLGQGYNGFGFNERAEPPSSEMLANTFRPYVETCIEAFGASRSMFESNFPVDKVSYSYPIIWNACKLMAKGASSTAKADLFSGSAARCYRLDAIPGQQRCLAFWAKRLPSDPNQTRLPGKNGGADSTSIVVGSIESTRHP